MCLIPDHIPRLIDMVSMIPCHLRLVIGSTSAVLRRDVPSNPPTANTSPLVDIIETPLRRDLIGVIWVHILFVGQ